MKKGLISKIFAILLVVGLLIAVAPTKQAQAAAAVSNQAELTAALAGTESEITLAADISIPGFLDASVFTVPAGRTVTLDLNGKTISADVHRGGVFSNVGNLTIVDTSTSQGGKIINTNTTASPHVNVAKSAISNTGVLTVNSGVTVAGPAESQGTWDSTTVFNPAYGIDNLGGGQVTVNGATVSGSYGLRNFANGANTSITINGGTITGKTGIQMQSFGTVVGSLTINGDTNVTASTGSAIYASGVTQYNQIVINDGTFSAENQYGTLYVAYGSLAINGGTFIDRGNAFSLNNYNANITVTGGSFNGKVYGGYGTGLTTFAPSGGEKIYVRGGVEGNISGREHVVVIHSVVDGGKIQDAIDAAYAGDIIEVAAGTYNENLHIGKTLTLQGAGAEQVIVTGIVGHGDPGMLSIAAPDVTIEGFTFQGADPKVVRPKHQASGLVFKNNKVIGLAVAGGILLETDTTGASAPLTDVQILNNQFVSGAGSQMGVYVNPYHTGLKITGNTFSGGPINGPALGVDGMTGSEVITGNTFTLDSTYALFEAFGTYDIDEIFDANTWPAFYAPIGNMVKMPATKLLMDPAIIKTTGTCLGPLEVTVKVQAVANMASYQLYLTYDPNMVLVTNVENVSPLPGGPAPDNSHTGGTIKFGWAPTDGGGTPPTLTGDYSLIKITFYPRSIAGTGAFTLLPSTWLLEWPEVEEIPYEFTGGGTFSFGAVAKNLDTGTEYCALAQAFSEASTDHTIQLLDNVNVTGSILTGKTLTFDTNSFNVTRSNATKSNDSVITVSGGNISITGNGSVTSTNDLGTTGTAVWVQSKGTLTLDGATLSGGDSSVWLYSSNILNSANFTMESGTLTDGLSITGPLHTTIINGGLIKNVDGVYSPIVSNKDAGGTLTINGGTITGEATGNLPAIYHPQNGTLNINGGTITGPMGIQMQQGTLNISGAPVITGTNGDAIFVNGSAAGYPNNISVTITGGEITATGGYALHETAPAAPRTSTISVSGGRFTGSAGAVSFGTVDPAFLMLTDGAYNTDPGDSPDYVFEPLDTYLHTDNYYHIMEVFAGTFSAFTADGLIVDQPDANTINFSGNIPWYNYQAVPERLQGNRVGMYVTEPTGLDLTGATIKIYRDGTLYYEGAWTASKDAASDNFVPYWALVTDVPQEYTIEVQWNQVSKQTFTATVVTSSVLLPPPAPIISSTDIQGYYLAGETREFNVSMKNPDLGANYARMIFDYKLAGVTVDDIESFEYLAPAGDPRAGQWIVMTDSGYETFANCTDGSGVCGQFGWAPGGFGPVPAGFENTSKFRINFNKGFAAPLAFTLDLSGKLDVADTDWTLLTTYDGVLDVHDKPVITVVSDPYFIVNEAGQFVVTISNPATGRNYGNNIVFDVLIPDHVLADFDSMSCGPWSVTLVQDGDDVKARILGLDTEGRFDVGAPFGPMDVTCTATLKTAGEYLPSWSMVDMTLSDERVVQTGTGGMVVYTKPTIGVTFPTDPISAGVPVTVPVTITNPDQLADPFELVITVPEGTVITLEGYTVVCSGTTCTITIDLTDPAAYPVTLPLVITFPAADTLDISFELFDRDWIGTDDRLLATFTQEDLAIGGGYTVSGTITMQGRSGVLTGIPVTLYWDSTFATYGPTMDTTADAVNFHMEVLYGGSYKFTTLQPRYLNITADMLKTIDVTGDKAIASLWMRSGNAYWRVFDETNGYTDQYDNSIDGSDASVVGTMYGNSGSTDLTINHGDVNFDNIVNIKDLTLVGGNMNLSSGGTGGAYTDWLP